ncbi:hypothetical protein K0M31_008424 [Melipona bicolor]|uniref:Uncharacterized protein n=1 Tax=Melipona bicolor TaxID=60889 RepID=A0AA40KKI4_9HYME|nr:hypothetical protein K0M31_008424 [Melipona bicolor]
MSDITTRNGRMTMLDSKSNQPFPSFERTDRNISLDNCLASQNVPKMTSEQYDQTLCNNITRREKQSKTSQSPIIPNFQPGRKTALRSSGIETSTRRLEGSDRRRQNAEQTQVLVQYKQQELNGPTSPLLPSRKTFTYR